MTDFISFPFYDLLQENGHVPEIRKKLPPLLAGVRRSVLEIACKARRASRCLPCAEVYRADTYQLIRAGLSGGKGVPATVADHPCVFVTLTAPSFGPVHSRREKDGRLLRCRPRRSSRTCPHGIRMSCTEKHAPDDDRLGEPLCPEC